MRVTAPAPLLRQKHSRSSDMLLDAQAERAGAVKPGAWSAVAVGMRAAMGGPT
jgi:hypothetical protein